MTVSIDREILSNVIKSSDSVDILNVAPRRKLFEGHSRVSRLDRLERKLGLDVEIYVKRDDQLRPLCGNKIRYIEYVLGAFDTAKADCLVHCGGQASNYLAQLAIVGAQEHIDVHLILLGKKPKYLQGNPLLEDLFGAKVTYMEGSPGLSCGKLKSDLAQRLQTDGRNPLVIDHPFANNAGILGYMKAYDEIVAQTTAGELPEIDQIVLCSAGNSYLGLCLGAALSGASRQIVAFSPIYFAESGLGSVARDRSEFVAKKVAEFSAFAGRSMPPIKLDIDESQVGFGYGRPSDQAIAALRLVASTEGILLDPIYSAKAFAGLLARIQNKSIPSGSRILFIHTGGLGNVFSQAASLGNNAF